MVLKTKGWKIEKRAHNSQLITSLGAITSRRIEKHVPLRSITTKTKFG